MYKQLTASLLLAFASLSASATPDTLFKEWLTYGTPANVNVTPPSASATPVFGGSFFVVDQNKPVEFTFVTSEAGHNLILSVATLDSNGSISGWQEVFKKTGSSVGTFDYLIDPRFLSYTGTGPELTFKLDDQTSGYTYYSGLASNNPDNFAHAVSYYDYYQGQTLVGFEDLYGGGDKDFDDIVFLVSNVSSVPTPVPEPETYAMLLAGLGIIGMVTRRQRKN